MFLDQGTFSAVIKTFHGKENFPQSWKFSTAKEIFQIVETFHSHRIFPQTRKFSTKKVLLDKESFLQKTFFPLSRKFSTNKGVSRKQKCFLDEEVFHKQIFLHSQNYFLQIKNKKIF